MEPVSTETLDATYTATLSLPRQSASMIILGLTRPVTGRNALVDMEGEDYDGQSGITREDCSDTSMGQSITGNGKEAEMKLMQEVGAAIQSHYRDQ